MLEFRNSLRAFFLNIDYLLDLNWDVDIDKFFDLNRLVNIYDFLYLNFDNLFNDLLNWNLPVYDLFDNLINRNLLDNLLINNFRLAHWAWSKELLSLFLGNCSLLNSKYHSGVNEPAEDFIRHLFYQLWASNVEELVCNRGKRLPKNLLGLLSISLSDFNDPVLIVYDFFGLLDSFR